MDAAAERRQQHEPPVAELVPEALDDDPPVGRQGSDDFTLVLEVGDEVLGGELVEVVVGLESVEGGSPASRAPTQVGFDLANERPQRPAELDRPPDRVAVPERQLARHARRRRHRDPVVADLLDPPARCPERDHLADPALVDHLLVELADAPAGRPGLADHEDAVQPAVRDRAAARDSDDAGVAAALDDVRGSIPRDARLQLGELVARVGAGEHPEHALEDLAAERLVRRRPGDRCRAARRPSSDP